MVSFISPRDHKYIKGVIILDNKNNILFMTEHYSKEWMYRHEHYWKMVTKYTILCTAIIFMPYLSNIGIELPNQNNSIFFSVVGIILSAIFGFYLWNEAARLDSVGSKLYELVKDLPSGKRKEFPKIFKMKISYCVPFVIFCFHLFIAIMYIPNT